jgi:Holliday junction resolvasome RuvABC ATP-dependent DNA helicase subunit
MKYIVDSQRKPTAGLAEASAALHDAQIDEDGLGPIHRRVLVALARHGRPMAIGRVARLAGVSTEAFRRFYEPALIELGLITATARGLTAGGRRQRPAGGAESGT